jgi:hypothetical protein
VVVALQDNKFRLQQIQPVVLVDQVWLFSLHNHRHN